VRPSRPISRLSAFDDGGAIVLRPGGDTALDETFELSPADSGDESPVVACGDVRKGTGEYDVGIGLTDVEVNGTSEASGTVTIGNTGVDVVAVAVGSEETDESTAIRVGESFSDRFQTDQ
jgi:hypothetical protein